MEDLTLKQAEKSTPAEKVNQEETEKSLMRKTKKDLVEIILDKNIKYSRIKDNFDKLVEKHDLSFKAYKQLERDFNSYKYNANKTLDNLKGDLTIEQRKAQKYKEDRNICIVLFIAFAIIYTIVYITNII